MSGLTASQWRLLCTCAVSCILYTFATHTHNLDLTYLCPMYSGGKFGALTLGGALRASPFPATQAWTSVLAMVHRAPSGGQHHPWSLLPVIPNPANWDQRLSSVTGVHSGWVTSVTASHTLSRGIVRGGGGDSGLTGALACYPYFSPIHQRV